MGSATGLVFILYNAASIIGCAFGGPIMDYFGRRRGMQSGCLFTLAGAALAAGSQTQPQFKASRFLLGFGVILQTLSAPVYVTEIIPPQWRGRLGGFYNTFYVRDTGTSGFRATTNRLLVHGIHHWHGCCVWHLADERNNRMEASWVFSTSSAVSLPDILQPSPFKSFLPPWYSLDVSSSLNPPGGSRPAIEWRRQRRSSINTTEAPTTR